MPLFLELARLDSALDNMALASLDDGETEMAMALRKASVNFTRNRDSDTDMYTLAFDPRDANTVVRHRKVPSTIRRDGIFAIGMIRCYPDCSVKIERVDLEIIYEDALCPGRYLISTLDQDKFD
jgi:hypothetical protein